MTTGAAVISNRPRRTGLHRDVVDGLGRRIVTGSLAPGEVLGDAASLSAGTPVSRTVAREAIKVLAAKGLVVSRPKVGTRVLPRAYWNLLDPDVLAWSLESQEASIRYGEIYEVRMIIEPRVAALAAARRSDEEADLLRDLVDRMTGAIDDVETFVGVDLELHAAILDAAHNEILARLSGTIRLVWNACQRISALAPGSRARAIAEHRAVVEAIRSRDEEAAATTNALLITRAADDLRVVLAAEPQGTIQRTRSGGISR
jgi:GntR family transcriptional regulator, galactonate operon transcriptional repressor